MQLAHLGRSGLSVSRLCLGTMNFGPQTSESDAFAIMDAALDHGINFFDTANVYGWKKGEGVTEQIIGRWFASGGLRRQRTVIATKLYGSMSDWPNDTFLSARNIRHACDASLMRLQTDHIDLYQMHHVDRDTPWDEIWEAWTCCASRARSSTSDRRTSRAGTSRRRRSRRSARRSMGLVSEQSIYNLLQRDVERELIPACQDYGLGVIPWSPLHGGLLAGVIRKENQGARRLEGRAKDGLEEHREQLEKWEALCDELGAEPAVVGIAWLLGRPGVTAPIIGPRTREQLDSMTAALDLTLDEPTLARIDEIFPPHQTAPEVYAW